MQLLHFQFCTVLLEFKVSLSRTETGSIYWQLADPATLVVSYGMKIVGCIYFIMGYKKGINKKKPNKIDLGTCQTNV